MRTSIITPDYSASELYLALVLCPRGTQVAVHPDGHISTHDDSMLITWEEPEPVAILHAEGDYDRTDWGIHRTPYDSAFYVETIDGKWDDSDDALRAAVAAFGVHADIIEDLDRRIIERIQETRADAASQ